MARWTTRTTTQAAPEQVLAVLTDPEAIRTWSPSVAMRRAKGLTGRLVASATGALLSAGALEGAAGRIARAAEATA